MRVLDLFSGVGGFSLGLERAGFQTVAFCEIEPFCRAVLRKHWPGVPIYEDVRTLTADALERDGITDIDAICGGFPCQDVSVAGKRAGLEGERSGLWSEIRRLAGELRPRFIMLENVTGLLNLGMDTVLGDLSKIGYDATWDCIPASALGACHRRDRVWIIAHTNRRGNKRLQHKLGEPGARGPGGAHHEADCNRNAPDTLRRRSPGQGRAKQPGHSAPDEHRQVDRVEHVLGWPTKPAVRRRDDGVSRGLDTARLKALGNAIVPQVAEVIGRAILQAQGGE